MAKKVKGKKAVPKSTEKTESFVKDILIPLLVGASALFTVIKANQTLRTSSSDCQKHRKADLLGCGTFLTRSH